MAPRLQPPTLLSLAHAQVAQNLANICRVLHTLAQETCVTHVLNLTKNTLRPVWQSSIPACIRAQLLEETTALLSMQSSDSAGSTTGAAPLYLLVLLLANDIKTIRIELCCYYGCSHQTSLLKFLANEGHGLHALELARSTLLRLDRSLLQSVLVSATSLRYLTFKNIANDSILQIIGSHCPNLVSLDVSHSKEVTDTGLKQLFLRVEIRDKAVQKSISKINVRKDAMGKIKRNLRSVAKFLRRVCLPYQQRDSTAKELMAILEYCELRNSLCSTLKCLNIANTGVTNAGILLAILHVPGLESLGEYCHIGRALELLEQTVPSSLRQNSTNNSNDNNNNDKGNPGAIPNDHYFQLRCVNSSRTTQHRLELISQRFPHLRKLKITEPMFLPKSLFIIPRTIVALSLHSIPSTDQWLRTIFEYLNGSQGATLTEVSLRFFPGDVLPTIELNSFLPNCRNLRALNLDGAHVTWDSDDSSAWSSSSSPSSPSSPSPCTLFARSSSSSSSSPPPIVMEHLEKVQIGKVITTDALNKLLLRCPALRIMHIYSCNQLDVDEMFKFKNRNDKAPIRESQIECFYVYETSCLTRDTLQSVANVLPNVKRIGNIRNCGLSSDDIRLMDTWITQNNLNVNLHAGSHWFSSSCFPL